MIRFRANWLLWLVFAISLVWFAVNALTGHKPTQQLMMIQLLGIGCGLIAMMRRRRKS
ncbi:MAG TPA: hypothetical protein VFQ30_01625 [Ktedonobacteraceae bacterium]|nr:hypothetical protein [Ktedonobacteraceae bacterium]